MSFDITSFQPLAANLPVEGEVCDLTHAEISTQTEVNTVIVTLIQQVAVRPIAEIDPLVTELQAVKRRLQLKGERVEEEMARYMKLTQMASFTTKIILDTTGIPRATHKSQALPKVMMASTENNMGAFETNHHHNQGTPPNSVGTLMPLRGTRRMPTLAWHPRRPAAVRSRVIEDSRCPTKRVEL
jgi:hypothetical protein